MTWTWVEPFAGAAACALRLVGGPSLLPPVAWMGGKRRLAPAILGAMGVPEGRPGRVVLSDAGPWGWVWPLLLELEASRSVGAHLRAWACEHPRALWERLAAHPPAEDLHERAAQWLWLQARSASGVPIWWDGWRFTVEGRSAPQSTWGRFGEDNAGRWKASDGQPRPAGARAVGGRWDQGSSRGRPAQPIGQRGRPEQAWRMGKTEARMTDQAAWQKGESRGRTGGMVHPGTIADRIEAIAHAFRGVQVEVHHGDAQALRTIPGAWCYLDPPYTGSPAVIPPTSAALLLAPDSGDGHELGAALRAAGLNRLRKPVRHLRVALAEVLRSVIVEPKVLDRVVELVVVDVVDDFVFAEWASEVALHDQAVLGDCAALVAEKPVAVLNPAGPLACASRRGDLLPLVGHLRRALAEFYVAAANPTPVLAQALSRADVLAGEAALKRAHELGSADVALDLVARRHVTLRGLARQDIGNRHRRPGTPRPTGYGWDLSRPEVLALAQRWQAGGAVVAASEAVPLELRGWHQLELTVGRKPEWLTLSRAPVRVPERQRALFGGAP